MSLADLDATATVELIASGQASAAEVVDAAIARVEEFNPQLNAVIHERFDRARKEAANPVAGPLSGVPIVVKDLDGWLAGEPWHGGIQFLKDNDFRPPVTSALFRRMQDAGAVIVGKTNTPELGLVTTTEPEAYGPARNPWNPDHSTGGSSGGSAAAVAARLVPAGHAGDGGGSIRIPASECGLVGLKPSRGRVSLGPEAAEGWAGLVARLVVTRSVRDTALFLDVGAGLEPGDPYTAPAPTGSYVSELSAAPGTLRVGVTTTPHDGITTEAEIVAIVQRVASTLTELGHNVSDAAPTPLVEDLTPLVTPILGVSVAHELEVLGAMVGKAITPEGVEAGTWMAAELGRGTTGAQYLAAVEGVHDYTRRMAAWFDDFDVLVTPTIPELPPTLGQFTTTPESPLNGLFRAANVIPFTMPFNVSGLPAISLPLGMSASGLPIGVQFVAAPWREDVLIRLAAQLEVAMPWANRKPPISA